MSPKTKDVATEACDCAATQSGAAAAQPQYALERHGVARRMKGPALPAAVTQLAPYDNTSSSAACCWLDAMAEDPNRLVAYWLVSARRQADEFVESSNRRT